MEVHVPHDVIFNHILPRVPTKSVCRFMCLSKEWHSFLTSDMFKNKHNHHVDDQKNNLKLLVLSKTKTYIELTTIDCEEAVPRRKGLTATRRHLPLFEDTNPYDIHILTSFHGLVCLGIIKDNCDVGYSDLILWNPLTNEYKRLSKPNSHMMALLACNSRYSKFGLYYNCCEEDYKLLFVNLSDDDLYIYSLNLDSWRKVDASESTHILYPGHWSRGTYLNENLYFLQHHSDGRSSSIIRFDTKTERLSKIETPYDIPNACASIMIKSDCIHLCVKYDIISCDNGFERTICFKLWKLDEYENMKEVVTYQLRPHLGHTIEYMRPFHLMKNGNWLMLDNWWCSNNHQIYKIDLKKKIHITNKGKGKEKGNIFYDFEYAEVRVNGNTSNTVAEEGRYIETFVSPNGNTNNSNKVARYMK